MMIMQRRIQGFGAPVWTVLPAATQVQLPHGADAVLPGGVAVALAGPQPGVTVVPLGAANCELAELTAVTLPDGRAGALTERSGANLPVGALVELPDAAVVMLDGSEPVTLPRGACAEVTEYSAAVRPRLRQQDVELPPESRVSVPPGTLVTLDPTAAAGLRQPAPAGPAEQAVGITVVSGAAIVALAGATIAWPGRGRLKSAAVQAGKTIQVSPGSKLCIPAGVAISLPGGSDIPVPAGSAINLGDGSTLAVAGGDLVPPPKGGDSSAASTPPPPPDLTVTCPAWISLPGGAKVTVTGSADITIPEGTVLASPQYLPTSVRGHRDLQVPQGTNVITGTLWMTLIAAFVTMFGIGAEFGIAGVLAFGLSEASLVWRSLMLVAIVAAGLGVLCYAVTAIAALADPQPGSSLSARSGTSFTL